MKTRRFAAARLSPRDEQVRQIALGAATPRIIDRQPSMIYLLDPQRVQTPSVLPEGMCRTCRHEGLIIEDQLCLHCLNEAGRLKQLPLN